MQVEQLCATLFALTEAQPADGASIGWDRWANQHHVQQARNVVVAANTSGTRTQQVRAHLSDPFWHVMLQLPFAMKADSGSSGSGSGAQRWCHM